MSAAFDWHPPKNRKTAKELKELLTSEEYEAARASTPNAHFTSPMVIAGIWKPFTRLGIPKDPGILEPSMGVGHFFGMMPEESLRRHRTGVELDSVTARIAQKLYPDSTVFARGSRKRRCPRTTLTRPSETFLSVITPSTTPPINERSPARFTIIPSPNRWTSCAPAAVMALITSRYTMDKQDESIAPTSQTALT